MGMIKPASDAQYFGKRGHVVYESGDRGPQAQDLNDINSEIQGRELEDRLEFSPRAQEVLREVAIALDRLFQDYPEYSHIFTNGKSQAKASHHALSGLAFMGHFRSFLNNPHFQKLAQQDSEFGAFYQKVENLGKMSQVALSQSQQRVREQSPATYARPRKIFD